MRSPLHCSFTAVLVLLGASHEIAIAQEDELAHRIEELQRELEGRDAQIENLSRRMRELEQSRARPPASDARGDRESPGAESPSATSPESPAPDSVDDVDDELVARALERTLVREGGLLLRPWSLEVEPRVSYAFREQDALQIVEIDGEPRVAEQHVRHEVLQSIAALRLGLPWNIQAEIGIPHVVDREKTITAGLAEPTRRESELGDVDVAFSKQLRFEQRSGFDLLGGLLLSGNAGLREVEGLVTRGSDYDSVQASLTAVKRRDPLVFFGTASYAEFSEETLSERDVEPGRTVRLRVGTILAASPDASVRIAFDLSRSRDLKVDGQPIRGSGTTVALLEIGAATVLGARTLFGFEVGLGVTDAAPDYLLATSLSYRVR